MAMPRRMVPSSAASTKRALGPYASIAATHRTATTASMMGYCAEIGCPHQRHRPRSSSHETTGMLSRQAMRRPQRGQVDGGRNNERCFLSSLASRRMQTLRKLPIQSPRSPAPTSRIGSTATQHLVEQDTRRDRDVERLRALGQWDRHALRGDGVELGADARPLVSHDDREDPLRRLGIGQLREHARAALLHLDRLALELRDERRAARGARQVGADQGPLECDAGRECFLHEPDTLDQGEAAPATRLTALEITDRRLQITGDESPRAFPAAAEPSICEEAWDRRYVKIALTIAGSDSGGGAGIQADLKTLHQFGVVGTSVITAVTAQNTMGVRAWEPPPPTLVTQQPDAPAHDLPPPAAESGLLGSAGLVEGVAHGIPPWRL